MSHYKPYPAYRDSGVEWIGQVPEHWRVTPLKVIAETVNGTTPESGKPEYWDGDIAWYTPTDIDNEVASELGVPRRYITQAGYESCAVKLSPPGSVILSTRAPIGSVGITTIPSTINQGCRTLIPAQDVPTSYLASTLVAAREELRLRGNGTTFQELSTEALRSLRVPMPPRSECVSIASGLDRETARFDALIAKKTRFIELLKEKRQALITHAVTKGLNPKAKMKASGVEWIGEVPEHWVAIKFNHVARVTEGLVDPKAHPYREMVLIAPNHIESGTGKILGLETAVFQNAESGKYTCKKGAVIYSKIRPALAKVAIAPCDCLCSADMYPMDCTDRTYPEWLFYLMLSPPFTSWAILESDRVAMPKINRESLADLRVFLPPMDEQLAAVAWLKAQVEKLEIVSLKTQHSIDLLKERRAAFITAAVTGQIDLRESA